MESAAGVTWVRAIWFRGEPGLDTRPEVATCANAREVRAALAEFFSSGIESP